MKFERFYLASIAILGALFLMTSCEIKEQTAFTLEDIEDTAIVKGTLTYPLGQSFNGNKFQEVVKPASNVKVTVFVKNADLSPNGEAGGVSTFSAKTDANGKYEIIVPVVLKDTIYMEASLSVESFEGVRRLISGVSSSGQPNFDETNVMFCLDPIELKLTPDAKISNNVRYGYKEIASGLEFNSFANYKVSVGMGVINNKGEAEFDFEPGKTVIIDVVYPIEEEGGEMVRKFALNTDYSGEVRFEIPTPSTNIDLEIYTTVMPFEYSYFSFYTTYNSDRKTIQKGRYRQYYESRFVTYQDDEFSFTGGQVVSDEVRMVFVPDTGVDNKGYYYNNYSWSSISF